MDDNIKLKLSDEVISNYKKLAELLTNRKPEHFRMGLFAHDCRQQKIPPNKAERHNSCETTACALGWAAILGVGKTNYKSWQEYHLNNFAGPVLSRGKKDVCYQWCFSGLWEFVDPTPEGVVARINYMLEHGIPSDYYEQVRGEETYIFVHKVQGWMKKL